MTALHTYFLYCSRHTTGMSHIKTLNLSVKKQDSKLESISNEQYTA